MQRNSTLQLSETYKVSIKSLNDDPFAKTLYNLGNIDLLAELLSQQGQLEDILITEPIDGMSRILSGRRRRLAAEKLGWLEINARIVKGISPQQEKDIVVSANQHRKKEFYEFLNEARYAVGTLGMQQGKEREFIGKDGDENFGKVSHDRFELAAKFINADMKGSTLRKLIYVDDFERDNPDAGLGLIDKISRRIISIDRAFKLIKSYGNIKGEAPTDQKADQKKLLEPTNWQIFHQSCLNMSQLADGAAAAIATSIPYYNLRDYRTPEARAEAIAAGDKSELGQEENVHQFIVNLKPYLVEMKRVLNDKGSLWLNVGDTYSKEVNNIVSQRLVIMACDDLGWHLVNEIIFQQTARLPQTITKRLQPTYEKVLHFVKNAKEYNYYPFIVPDDKKKITPYKIDRQNKDGKMDKGDWNLSKPYSKFKDFITSQEQADIIQHCNVQSESGELKKLLGESHIAPYSTSLMLLPILTTTKPGDLVVDPFGGSGSTLITAVLMGRKATMYEKQERYVELAKKRIALVAKEFNPEQAEYLESIGKAKVDIAHFANPSLNSLKKAPRKKAA